MVVVQHEHQRSLGRRQFVDERAVSNAASGGYALKVMTIVAVLLLPVVLLYQGWSFYVFRGRVTAPAESADGRRAPEPPPAPLGASPQA